VVLLLGDSISNLRELIMHHNRLFQAVATTWRPPQLWKWLSNLRQSRKRIVIVRYMKIGQLIANIFLIINLEPRDMAWKTWFHLARSVIELEGCCANRQLEQNRKITQQRSVFNSQHHISCSWQLCYGKGCTGSWEKNEAVFENVKYFIKLSCSFLGDVVTFP
jgi:hypothetical protein